MVETTGKVSGKRVYSGRIVSLDVDTVRFPDGSIGELELFRHPGASAVVPFLSDPFAADPQILLIRQYRYAANGYLYEIPAGRLDPGEEPLDCARRELREETGCTAENVQFMCTTLPTPGFCDERIHIFMADGLAQGEAGREADEFMEVETFALSRALEMIQSGQIQDGKTALGLLFAAGFRVGK
ncbi:MAG: NUDIX hydrolase [Anaerolineae bacterium]|nr:NUDIX hydrolase [Gemmatimonadaceae bacterium]